MPSAVPWRWTYAMTGFLWQSSAWSPHNWSWKMREAPAVGGLDWLHNSDHSFENTSWCVGRVLYHVVWLLDGSGSVFVVRKMAAVEERRSDLDDRVSSATLMWPSQLSVRKLRGSARENSSFLIVCYTSSYEILSTTKICYPPSKRWNVTLCQTSLPVTASVFQILGNRLW